MQTEKAKSSHFDRTRGLKNQIFPTLDLSQIVFGQKSQKAAIVKGQMDIFFSHPFLKTTVI